MPLLPVPLPAEQHVNFRPRRYGCIIIISPSLLHGNLTPPPPTLPLRTQQRINSAPINSFDMASHLCKRLVSKKLSCVKQAHHPSRLAAAAAYSATSGGSAAAAHTDKEVVAKLPQLPAFDFTPAPYTGPLAAQILEKRRRYMNPGIILYYKKHINIVQGKMQYLYDETGRRYLDAFGGIVTVSCGHCHPEVVDAIVKQTQLLQHTTTIYLNRAVTDFAEALAQKLPGNLKVVYFVNSGGEANDMALMMARLYTGNFDVIALRNAYHGLSSATMGLNGQRIYKHGIPQGFGVHHAKNPNAYRGEYGSDGPKYAADVAELIETSTSGRIAGFFAETFQGVGGAVELAPGYLPSVYEMVRKAGGVCIADEVQTAFGRLGTHYWGFETQGVVPDIVTMAKGLGNGLPVAAVVTTPEIASVLSRALHFNTFGGNPVCSAGGHAVLRVLDKEKRQQHCAQVGTYLLNRLHHLKDKHDIIGDVRGRGLMIGVELVRDRQTQEPAKEETAHLHEEMKELGVLVGKGGMYGNVFRIKPPMCFTSEDADFLVDVMDYTMSKM